MKLEDIIWSISQYNRLGRSSLKDVAAKPFDSGTISLSGSTVSIQLFPPTGFLRTYESLVTTPNATAAGDRIFLIRANRELNIGQVLVDVEVGAAFPASLAFPLINGRMYSNVAPGP